LALGIRLSVQEIIAPLRRRRLVVLALVANFVLGPIFAYFSTQLISMVIPLERGYVIGLMIIAFGSPDVGIRRVLVLASGQRMMPN
jgi:predicted Na+-dependent transporter